MFVVAVLLLLHPLQTHAASTGLPELLRILEDTERPMDHHLSFEIQSQEFTGSLEVQGTTNGNNDTDRLQADLTVELKYWIPKDGIGSIRANVKIVNSMLYIYIDEIKADGAGLDFAAAAEPMLKTWIRFPLKESAQSVMKKRRINLDSYARFQRFFIVKYAMQNGVTTYQVTLPKAKQRQFIALLRRQLRTALPEAKSSLRTIASPAVDAGMTVSVDSTGAAQNVNAYLDLEATVQGRKIQVGFKEQAKALASFSPVQAPSVSKTLEELSKNTGSSARTATPKEDIPKNQLPYADWKEFKSDEWFFKVSAPSAPKNTRDWTSLIPEGTLQMGDRFTFAQEGGGGYEVIAHRYGFPDETPSSKVIFQGVVDAYAAQFPGVTIASEDYWKDNGWDGADFAMYTSKDDRRTHLYGRMLFNGVNFYLVLAQSGKSSDEKFLESFWVLR